MLKSARPNPQQNYLRQVSPSKDYLEYYQTLDQTKQPLQIRRPDPKPEVARPTNEPTQSRKQLPSPLKQLDLKNI